MEVREGCICQVNVLQCTLKGVETVVNKYIRWKYVPLGCCLEKEAIRAVVVDVVEICLYLCEWLNLVSLYHGMIYCLGLMYKRLFVILYVVMNLASALLCSRVDQERAEAKVDTNISQL